MNYWCIFTEIKSEKPVSFFPFIFFCFLLSVSFFSVSFFPVSFFPIVSKFSSSVTITMSGLCKAQGQANFKLVWDDCTNLADYVLM